LTVSSGRITVEEKQSKTNKFNSGEKSDVMRHLRPNRDVDNRPVPLDYARQNIRTLSNSFIRHRTRRCALDPDNATVLVVGGDRLGLESVRRLKDLGSWAYMLPDGDIKTRQLEEMNVVVMKGDLNDSATLKNMFQSERLQLTKILRDFNKISTDWKE